MTPPDEAHLPPQRRRDREALQLTAMSFPYIAWSYGDAEVIACAADRFRLIWQGRYVGRFPVASAACDYARREFLERRCHP